MRGSTAQQWLAFWLLASQLCFTWWIALFMYWTAMLVFPFAAFCSLCTVTFQSNTVSKPCWDPQRRVRNLLWRLFVRECNKAWKRRVQELRRDGRWQHRNFERERLSSAQKVYEKIYDPYLHQRRTQFLASVMARIFGTTFLVGVLLGVVICTLLGVLFLRLIFWQTFMGIAARLAVILSENNDMTVSAERNGYTGWIITVKKQISTPLECRQYVRITNIYDK